MSALKLIDILVSLRQPNMLFSSQVIVFPLNTLHVAPGTSNNDDYRHS